MKPVPTGRSHAVARRLRVLRRDRGVRDSGGVLVAEGIHLVEEALASGADVEFAVVSPRLLKTERGRVLQLRLEREGVPLHGASDSLLDSLQDTRSPQPVVAVVRRTSRTPREVVDACPAPALLAAAVGVQDPGNLGSLLRSADAAGAGGFLVAGGGADLYHSRTIRGTMGSIFRLPAACCTEEELVPLLREAGIRTVAAVPRASTPYHREDLTGPVAIVLGGEGAGLPEQLLDGMDRKVAIPMCPGVESLSVGAAGAVLLFEAARQRGFATLPPSPTGG